MRWVLLWVVLAGCRGEAVTPPGATKPWAAMNRDERMSHMQSVVLPRMREVFNNYDATRFASFGCATCHGAGVADGTYAMPNPALLQFPAHGFRREVYEPHREMVRFMWSEVQPTMAELLGMRNSKWGRGPGFNCRNCHVRRDE